MAAAKSLTAAELKTVLAYTATQPYAQRNRAMLMMTVAAGLRVSEVAGLTLGDVLDSAGVVRSEVFLAAHRVKHQHARIIYINTRLQQELTDYIATRTSRDAALPFFPPIAVHAAASRPTRWRSTFIGCTGVLVLAMPVVTQDARHSSPVLQVKVCRCSCLHHLQDTKAFQLPSATSRSMMMSSAVLLSWFS